MKKLRKYALMIAGLVAVAVVVVIVAQAQQQRQTFGKRARGGGEIRFRC